MLAALLCAAHFACAQDVPVFRVDARSENLKPTGRTWAYAFSDLQDGIEAAFNAGGGEVWVKAGVYRPSGEQRDSTFELRPGVRLYGGFAGTEEERTARNSKANRTVLSGDVGSIGSDSDNCYHIVTGATDTLLDGFTISRGNANGLNQKGSGGGLLLPEGTRKMIVADCTFERNQAGWQGAAIYGQRVELTVTNCTFFSNAASNGGGLALKGESTVSIMDTVFSSNFAKTRGGAINLENAPHCVLQRCQFLYNTSAAHAGAVSIDVDKDAANGLEIMDCTFTDNKAETTGGALQLHGTFTPQVLNCRFERNSARKGTGGIVIGGGATAVVQACTFEKNRGLEETDISSDDASKVFNSTEELLASTESTEEKPEEAPVRMLDDVYVYNPQNKKTGLRGIVSQKPLTVITLGDLTDTAFIENYRTVEALARDFKQLDVQFFFLYGALAHPENNGYLRPFLLQERMRQVQLAKSLLLTRTPWLYDGMDNQAESALADDGKSNVFIFSSEGGERYRGTLDDGKSLRSALNNLAGAAPTQTDPGKIHSPKIAAKNAGKPELLDRIHFNPKTEPFSALRITPSDSPSPFYVKLRAEGDNKLLETGNGRLYLGFNLDPLYGMQWDNTADRLEYVIWAPSGIAAPSTDQAAEIKGHPYDSEPREFVLNTRQLDLSKPLRLGVRYTVYSPRLDKSVTVSQNYTIQLARDPFGGTAYRRQIPHHDPPRANPARMPPQLRHLDVNNDNKLSRAELSGNLWSKFPDIDTNKDGYLSADEYTQYLMTR